MQLVKKSLQVGAVVAETAALVLDATAEKLRDLAGDEAPAPETSPARAEPPPDIPHETHGETPAPGTRTRAAVSNPKAAKKVRTRERAGR